ncbi:MAG: peptidase dimerization domain protein, partial [Ignavibacteriae bacterium]|nr:peptidase dimerization domain protein [Ignavibacteriota bacterium]
MMKELLEYIDGNNNRYLNELVDFLKYPSVSTRERNKKDVLDCANWLKNNIISSGFETVEV